MSTPPSVQAHVQGDVSGQIAVGSHIYQIRDVHGGVINILPPEQRPELRPRPRPVLLRPRPFRGLLGREREVGVAREAVDDCAPIEVHGALGSGRTSLLRYLAHELEPGAAGDGMVYLSARGEVLDGILQALVDAFFESDGITLRLTPTELRHRLGGIRAVVLVDDVELDRESLVDLTDAAPGCAFVVTAEERRAWGDVRSLELGGLPDEAALELWEREAGPVRDEAERRVVEAICRSVGGLPLRIFQAAAAAKEEREGAGAVATRLESVRGPERPAEPARDAVDRLDHRTRRVMAALASAGSPLNAAQVALLADLDDAEQASATLDDLLRRRLVVRDGARFAPAGRMPELAAEAEGDEEESRRSVAVMAAWAAARQDRPAELAAEIGLLERSLERALDLHAWPQGVSLARSLDAVLSATGRWDTWHRLLERVAAAANRQGDDATEAWALHQQGTRAVILGDTALAAGPLARALDIRSRLGDVQGAALTRHNMEVAGLPVPEIGDDQGSHDESRPGDEGGSPDDAAGSASTGRATDSMETAGSTNGAGWAAQLPKMAAGGIGAVALAVILTILLGSDVDLSVTPERLDFGARAVGETSPALTVTVRNSGSEDLELDNVALDPPGIGFVVTDDGCSGQTLPSNGQCEVGLTFTPASESDHNGRLEVSHPDGTVGLALAGMGLRAAVGELVADAERVDFGALELGSTADRTIAIRNAGSAPVRVAGVEGPVLNAFAVDDAGCRGARLEPGSNCEIVIRFRPAQLGAADARVALVREGGDPVRIDVRGVGVAVPVGRLGVEPASVDLGTVTAGEVVTAELRVRSMGTARATISGVRLDGSPWFEVRDAAPCDSATLDPGTDCSLWVAFSPPEPGEAAVRLVIAAAGPVEAVVVALRGSAAERPVGRLAAKPSPVSFGERPVRSRGAPVPLEVGNTGNARLRIGALGVRGDEGQEFQVLEQDCADRVLEPGAACRVVLGFVPGGEGPRGAELVMRTDEGEGLFRVALQGVGAAPLRALLAVEPQRLTFGEAPVPEGFLETMVGALLGGSETVLLASNGTAPVPISSIRVEGEHAGDFDLRARACEETGSLVPGHQCELQVAFRPRDEGPRMGRIVIEHGGDGGRVVVALAGTGVRPADEPPPQTPPDLVVSLSSRGPATMAPRGGFEVPIRIQVTNRGGTAAGPFKVAIETPNGVAPFDVSGGSVIWYAETDGLAGGQSFSRDGVALVRAGEGRTVPLTGFVDSCAGEEFTPAHCRVQESDEGNNRSAPVQVRMPIPRGSAQ